MNPLKIVFGDPYWSSRINMMRSFYLVLKDKNCFYTDNPVYVMIESPVYAWLPRALIRSYLKIKR